MLPQYYQNISVNLTLLSKRGDYANLRPQSSSSMRPGFDPAQLLFDDLKVGSLTLHLFPMLNALLSGYTPTHWRFSMTHSVAIALVQSGIPASGSLDRSEFWVDFQAYWPERWVEIAVAFFCWLFHGFIRQENEKGKAKGFVVLNESSILGEIERLGSGLIKGITVHL
jgi:hypothetical protein